MKKSLSFGLHVSGLYFRLADFQSCVVSEDAATVAVTGSVMVMMI